MKARSGTVAALEGLLGGVISLATSGRMPVVVGALQRRPITKAVRNSASETITALGGAVAVPSAVRSSDSTTTMRRERRHHHQDGGRQRQHREQRDHLDHALGEAAALSEIDADICAPRRRRRQRQSATPTATVTKTDTAGWKEPSRFCGRRPKLVAISCSRLS